MIRTILQMLFLLSRAGRREKCKLPEDTVFKTKPQLAAEMLTDLNKEDILPF